MKALALVLALLCLPTQQNGGLVVERYVGGRWVETYRAPICQGVFFLNLIDTSQSGNTQVYRVRWPRPASCDEHWGE